MNLQFWCAAQGTPWTWTWQPIVGVWVVMLTLGYVYLRLYRSGPAAGKIPVVGLIGLALIWGAVDWPIGVLGAGYLSSVHALKFLVIAFIAPLLLWLDAHEAFEGVLDRNPRFARGWNGLTHPLVAALVFNGVLVTTHLPAVVQTLSSSQLGEFVNDMSWLVSGLVFYWPYASARRMRHKLAKIGYFFFGTLGHNAIAMTMLLVKHPLYAVYELAPRVGNLSARDDQALAGTVMLIGGTFFVFTVIGRTFVVWYREEAGNDFKAAR